MKKRFLLVLLAVFLFIPFVVNADTFGFDNVCERSAADGDIISCQLRLYGSGDIKLNKVSGRLVIPGSVFTLDHFEKSSYISDTDIDGLKFVFESEDGVPVETPIFTYYLKVNTDYREQLAVLSMEIEDIVIDGSSLGSFEDADSNEIQFDKFHESKLSDLSINGVSLSPSFDSNVLEYKASTDKESVLISGKLKDENATVNIDTLKNYKFDLEYGANIFELKVTAQDKSSRTYRIIITREDNRNDDSRLQLLNVNGNKIEILKNVYDYNVEVPYDVEEADLIYAPSSSTSTVEVVGSTRLKVGENIITLVVKSEKESTSKYIVNIERLDKVLSKDSSIKSLKIKNIKDESFNFKSDNKNYMIKIPRKVKSLDFEIELNDEKATYKVFDNENLENDSKVFIKVTAEDESTTTYSFLIEKEDLNVALIIVIVLSVIASIILIVMIILIIINSRRMKDNNNNNNDNSSNNSNNNDNTSNNEESLIVEENTNTDTEVSEDTKEFKKEDELKDTIEFEVRKY